MEKSRNSSNHVDLVVNEDNNTKLLRAQAHIWNHIFNFINSMSLKCAVELGIPDIINNHGKPMTISQLTLALLINKNKSHCLYRLMRLLTHSGFFALEKIKIKGEEEEEGYVITEASKLLLKDNPMSVTPLLLVLLDPTLTKPYDVLSTWFRNDDSTPFVTTNGMAIWDYYSHEPKLAQSFNEAMASDARLVTSVLIEKCKGVFEGVDSLVDVGGGTGTVAKSIAITFPQIQCSVLDLPHVVAGLQGEKNLNFIAGDMFVEWILHDWSDENSVKILKKCKEAITKSGKKIGKVVVIDMIIENEKGEIDDESYETQLFMNMRMILVSGRERNEKELSKLFKDAGFSHYKITPILAKVLVPFYPLVGRLRYDNGGRLEINCNLEGVLFMVAETESVMDDLVGCAPTVELLKLTPFIDRSAGVSSFSLLAAQIGGGLESDVAELKVPEFGDVEQGYSSNSYNRLHKHWKLTVRGTNIYRRISIMEKSRNSSSHVDLVVNEDNNTKLLRAQAHIWNHIFNFINSMSLKCAVELGIPDIVNNHGKPMTISQLTLALPINKNKSHCLYRLMRLLTHSGFFALEKTEIKGEEEEEEGYVITEASKLLLKDNPMSVTPLLLVLLDPTLTKPYDVLSTWFRNDDSTPFVTTNGMAIWDYYSHEPKLAQSFNEAMASDARLVTSVLIEKCKGVFEGVDSLVDVGGGTGTVAKSIATTFPQIQCSVLDLPHVVAGLQGEKNLNFIAGNMFVEWILHDWSDENSVKILKKCKEAITKSGKKIGKVVVIDMIIENEKGEIDDESYETQLFMDMTMTLVSGQERNEKELSKLFKDAGFSHYKITPILGLRSLIEIYP
ncbi:hypothetical protein G4B88_008992 [Cannabis sativa]|uniref:Uncharacterized protein n=1 Tax=Cannabis sativa TaxID=3483 RepID=A0A7J6HPE5_CANSA|nr:hypothetical protein G4B88_008992 [Cannabis sativa]